MTQTIREQIAQALAGYHFDGRPFSPNEFEYRDADKIIAVFKSVIQSKRPGIYTKDEYDEGRDDALGGLLDLLDGGW